MTSTTQKTVFQNNFHDFLQISTKDYSNLIGIEDFIPTSECDEINEELIKYKANQELLLKIFCCIPSEREDILNKIKNFAGDEKKLEEIINEEILEKIKQNTTFRLGNAIEKNDLEEAIEELFNRDYKDKKQIFVPEYFLAETPYDWKTFVELLEAIKNDQNFSNEEKEYWESKRENIRREALERNVYDSLKNFFYDNKDQEVLVLHGYELMDLTEGTG